MIKNFFSNTVLIGVSQGISKVVLFIFLPLLTAELSISDFGFLDLITTIVELCYPLLTIGITDAVLRFSMNNVKDRKSVFTYTLIIYLISSCFFVITSLFFINVIGVESILALNIMYLTYVLRLLSSQITKSLHKVKLLSLSNIVFAVCFSLFFVLFKYYATVTIVTYALIFGGANFLATIVSLSNKECVKYFSFKNLDYSVLLKMINYGKWLIPNSMSWWLLSWANRLLIISFLGMNFLGIYAVAFRVSGVINLLTGVLQQAWQLTALKEHDNLANKNKFQLIFNSLLIFMSVTAVVANFLGVYVIEYFFNETYFAASKPLPLLLTAAVFGLFSMFFGTAYLVNEKSKEAMTTTFTGGIISLLISLPLVYFYEISGIALSVCIGYLIIMMLRFKEGKKTFHLEEEKNIPFVFIMLFLLVNSLLNNYFQKNYILLIASVIILLLINFSRSKFIYLQIRKKNG